MTKTTNRLTAVGIKNLKEKGLYADGGGLYLRVAEGGTKGGFFVSPATAEPATWDLGRVRT